MGIIKWIFGKKKEEKEYFDKELKHEIKRLRYCVYSAPARVNELETLLANCKVEFNQAIAKGLIKNRDKIQAEIQKAKKAIEKARAEFKE